VLNPPKATAAKFLDDPLTAATSKIVVGQTGLSNPAGGLPKQLGQTESGSSVPTLVILMFLGAIIMYAYNWFKKQHNRPQ